MERNFRSSILRPPVLCVFSAVLKRFGGMAERLKAHAWKACVR